MCVAVLLSSDSRWFLRTPAVSFGLGPSFQASLPWVNRASRTLLLLKENAARLDNFASSVCLAVRVLVGFGVGIKVSRNRRINPTLHPARRPVLVGSGKHAGRTIFDYVSDS